MKKTILLVGFFYLVPTATAQQDPQYTQYMYNMIINPAYATGPIIVRCWCIVQNTMGWCVGCSKTDCVCSFTCEQESRIGLFRMILVMVQKENNFADFALRITITK
jgi:hypothetical protein